MLINCKNYFNKESFDELCKELEAGHEVEIYIDCIGHTRTYIESEKYYRELLEKYKDKLDKLPDYIGYAFKLRK